MHAVSTNQIADILYYNDKRLYNHKYQNDFLTSLVELKN